MKVTVRSPAGIASEIALLALALSSCSGGGTPAASVVAKQSSTTADVTPAPVDTQQGSTTGDATSPVAAGGATAFCAALTNGVFASGTKPGADTGDKDTLAAARSQSHEALRLAPPELKSDVAVLVALSDSIYDKLVAANFDATKLTAADMAGFATEPVVAAEKNLMSYMTKSCGGSADGGADSGPAQPDSSVSANPGAPSAAGACGLATAEEIGAATGKPMRIAGGGGDICVFSATSDPSFTVAATIYPDDASKALMKELEGAGADHLQGLGDTAFWSAVAGTVFVGKGTRGFSFSQPSLNNLTSTPDAVKAKFVKLATQAAARF